MLIIKGKRINLALPKHCDGLSLVELRGGGVVNSKLRIYSCFITNPKDKQKKMEVVKKEYCNGGFLYHLAGKRNYLYKADFFTDIKYSYTDELGRIHENCSSTYRKLVDKIQELIDEEVYLTVEEMEKYRLREENL